MCTDACTATPATIICLNVVLLDKIICDIIITRVNFIESRDILKQNKNDIFEIDFAGKKTPSKKEDSSFFDFSIKGNQPVDKKVDVLQDEVEYSKELAVDVDEEEIIDTDNTSEAEVEVEVEAEAEVEIETAVSEDVEVAKVSFTKSTHVARSVQDSSPAPSVSEDEIEVKMSSFKKVPAAPISNSENAAKDDVSITSVSWHKKAQAGQSLYRRTNVSPAPAANTIAADASNNDDLPAKKNSLIIETEDGFEIKMCNFRKLAGKGQVSAPNNKIKKN